MLLLEFVINISSFWNYPLIVKQLFKHWVLENIFCLTALRNLYLRKVLYYNMIVYLGPVDAYETQGAENMWKLKLFSTAG